MLKTTTVAQFDGFGNLKQKSLGEYFRGKGVSKGANGISFNKYVFETKDGNNNSIPARTFAYAKGLGGVTFSKNNVGEYLYMRTTNDSRIFQSFQGSFAPEEIMNFTTMNFVLNGGIIGDPKGRLIACGERYLALCDTSVPNYVTGSIQVTNGSGAVVGTGTTFTAGMVGKKLRVDGDSGTSSFYTITVFTDATHITISPTYGGTGGSGKSYIIFSSWTEQWKDFGTAITQTSTGTVIPMVMDNYESTVIFGRGNLITTLDTNTDTITTDASPAFTMPSGYTCKKVSCNKAGVLFWFDSFDGSTLVLWDNQSIRSVAPWIKMKDQVLEVMKYGSGWIVTTTRSVYFTDGYSLQILVDTFLDSEISKISGFTGEVVNNFMYFCINSNNLTKQRDGFYRMDLKSGLIEYWGTFNGSSFGNSTFYQVFYVPLQNFFVFSDSLHLNKVAFDSISSTAVSTYITNPVVKSSTKKVAKKVSVPIAQTSTYYSTNTEGFTLDCYISPVTRQQSFQFGVNTNSVDLSTLQITTANSPTIQVGECIEVIGSNNGGLVRYVTAVAPSGANTIITLNAPLTNLATTSDRFEYTPFQWIGTYTVTPAQAIEMKSLMYTVKKEIVGKTYMIKLVASAMSTPLEVLPIDFIYDDLGII